MLQRSTKNLRVEVSLLSTCAKELLEFEKSNDILFSPYLHKFCEEVLNLQEKEKNITPERAAKISAYIELYFANNPIVKTKALKEFSSELSSILQKNEIFALYSKYTVDIYAILGELRKITYMDTEVYFIDQGIRDRLVDMFASMDKLLITKTLERRFKLSTIVNFLNPNSCSHKYNVKYVSKFQHIKKPDSIERYLPANYEIWVNTTIKQFNTLLSTHKFDPGTIKKLTQEHDSILLRAKEEYQYIIDNKDSIEVRILGYENAKLYPEMHIVMDGGNKQRHLRSEAPNVLWFEPKPFRTNMEVKDYLENAQNAFGSVYYKYEDGESV